MVPSKQYDHPAYDLLARAHPKEQAGTIFVDKVIHKPVNLRPTSPDPNSQDARAHRRQQRLIKTQCTQKNKRTKRLSAKQKRSLGLYDIPKTDQKYEIFLPLHRLWLGYIREILGLSKGGKNYVTAASAGPILAAADFHGAELEVIRSRCVNRVGCKGIVAKDTKFTFEIITPSNTLKVVPKEHTIFRFEIPQQDEKHQAGEGSDIDVDMSLQAPNLTFDLHGSQLEYRAADRATKKFKQRRMDDL